jgi:hypothetical protein
MATVVPIIRDDESKLYIGEQFAPQPPSSKVSDQMIDLGEYVHPGDLEDRDGNTLAVFQYHKFLDLDTVDTESEAFDQVGTKQGDVEDAEIDDLVDNLRLDGFVKEDRLPQYDENEHPINGRMRTKAMSRKSVINPTVYGVDARWMPVSIYKWTEGVTYRQKAALYGRLSITRPHTLQTRKTFIKEGVALCAKGELDPSSENDVTNYVRYESAAGEKFTDMGGNLKKIIDGIQKLGQAVESGVANTKTLSRAGWIDKVTKDGYKLENKRLVLTSVDEATYAYRAFAEHILPAIREDKIPVKFILYTNKDDANEAKEAMNSFVTLIDKLWEDVFGGVNKVTKANFNPKDFDNPYIILGAVPQVIGRHNLDSVKLVPIDGY